MLASLLFKVVAFLSSSSLTIITIVQIEMGSNNKNVSLLSLSPYISLSLLLLFLTCFGPIQYQKFSSCLTLPILACNSHIANKRTVT